MTDVNVPPDVITPPRVLRASVESLRFLARWFAIFPVLGAAAALLVGVVTFRLIGGFGLPDLFWRLVAWKMVLTGASVALVFAMICFIGFLLESETPYVKERELTAEGYFLRTYPVLTLFFLIGALRFDFQPGLQTHYARAWVAVVGYALGFGLLVVFSRVVIPAVSKLAAAAFVRQTVRNVMQASEENVPLHAHAALVAVLLTASYIILSIWMPRIPSATAICIVLSMVVMGYGFVRFTVRNLTFIVIVLAVLVSGVVNVNSPYKHRYPQFGAATYDAPALIPPDGGKPNAALITNEDAFNAWLRSAQKGSEKPRLALVATSGGGIRAAIWTASVLKRLSAGDLPEFSKHVRVISGASGGMLGAAFYVAGLREGGDQVIEFSEMAADSLEPVALSLALRDIPALVLPGHFNDRGVALEQAWERNSRVMTTKLGELAPGERAGWRPSLIFTPMFVEDGRRALISNLELSFLSRNTGPAIGEASAIYSRPAVELQRVLPSASQLSIASIARMNASFPYVASAAELPTKPRRHVVDAGYWDNYGVSVSVAWLSENFQRIVDSTSGVVLIQIRDTLQQPANINAAIPSEPGIALEGFSEFVAPLVGALRARDSIMILRNDNDVQQIAKAFTTQTGDPQFFTTVVLENPKTSVLSWSLTDAQAADLLDYFHDNPDGTPSRRVNDLAAWWNRAEAPQAEMMSEAPAAAAVLP